MARTVAARVSRSSTAETTEADLAAMWREAARDAPIARAMMSNLIVFRRLRAGGGADRPADLPLQDVVAQHPSRVIAVEHDPRKTDGEPCISVELAVVAFGPPQAQYGVEQITICPTCSDASLPSIVRRLIRGDLPTAVWWTEDASAVPPMPAIVAMARQLVFDSRAWRDVSAGVRAVTSIDQDDLDLADVNWRRLLPLRRALVTAASDRRDAWRSDEVRVRYGAGDAALAWLAAGWLMARLDWPRPPTVQEEKSMDAGVAVEVGAGDAAFGVALDERRAVLTRGGDPPTSFTARREDEADAVAAELHSLSHDVCLRDALAALNRAFGAA